MAWHEKEEYTSTHKNEYWKSFRKESEGKMECNVFIFFQPWHGVVIKKVVILVITMSLTPLATALHILLFIFTFVQSEKMWVVEQKRSEPLLLVIRPVDSGYSFRKRSNVNQFGHLWSLFKRFRTKRLISNVCFIMNLFNHGTFICLTAN